VVRVRAARGLRVVCDLLSAWSRARRAAFMPPRLPNFLTIEKRPFQSSVTRLHDGGTAAALTDYQAF
jgi:hypothetical protein